MSKALVACSAGSSLALQLAKNWHRELPRTLNTTLQLLSYQGIGQARTAQLVLFCCSSPPSRCHVTLPSQACHCVDALATRTAAQVAGPCMSMQLHMQ